MTRYKSEQGYIEDKAGERTPLSHGLLHINKFIHDDAVRFEDLQKLAFDLATELDEVKQLAANIDNIVDHLNKFSYRQLLSVRESLGSIIRSRDDEPKVVLWMVTNESEDIACYPADQYQKACEKMASLILAEAKFNPDAPMQFHLERRTVRESEVSLYLETEQE